MFDSKVSQSTLTKEFAVAEKKLHLAVSGRKYDPGKKTPKPKPRVKSSTQKKKSAKPDEPKTDKKTKIPEDKQALPEDSDQPQSDDVINKDDNDSLPDPLHPKKRKPRCQAPKKTKVQKMHKQKWTVPELISSDDNDAPLKSFDTKNPAGIPKMSHHQPNTFTTKNPPLQPCHK